MRARTALLVSSLAFALGACQTTDDPAKGGFLSGLTNLSNGTYERRVQDRQQTLENEQDVNLQRNRSVDRLNAQAADVRSERDSAEAKASAMRRDLDSMRTRLAKAEKENKAKKQQAAALQKDVDALASRIQMLERDTFTPDAEKQARLEALRKEHQALEREVDLLVGR